MKFRERSTISFLKSERIASARRMELRARTMELRDGYAHEGHHRVRHPGPYAHRLRDALRPRSRNACAWFCSHAQALGYRRLPGFEARGISSDTDPISNIFSLFCFGLRASLLPLRFAMTASFSLAHAAARQPAARLEHGLKGNPWRVALGCTSQG